MLTDIDECPDDPCNGRPCINYDGGFECVCFECDCLSIYTIDEFCNPGELTRVGYLLVYLFSIWPVINPLSPNDAIKHQITSLKTNAIFPQQGF